MPLLCIMALVLECKDEKGTKKTFKTPDEAVQWYDKREKDEKPPVDNFTLNGHTRSHQAATVRREPEDAELVGSLPVEIVIPLS